MDKKVVYGIYIRIGYVLRYRGVNYLDKMVNYKDIILFRRSIDIKGIYWSY